MVQVWNDVSWLGVYTAMGAAWDVKHIQITYTPFRSTLYVTTQIPWLVATNRNLPRHLVKLCGAFDSMRMDRGRRSTYTLRYTHFVDLPYIGRFYKSWKNGVLCHTRCTPYPSEGHEWSVYNLVTVWAYPFASCVFSPCSIRNILQVYARSVVVLFTCKMAFPGCASMAQIL